MNKVRTYTFNRPVTALFIVPLLLIFVMLLIGMVRYFNLLAVVLMGLTLAMLVPIVYMSFMRRLRVGPKKFEWITPRGTQELAVSEIRHYGIVKYRSFRFMYVSRAERRPFTDAHERIQPDADTFVVQFRPAGWLHIDGVVRAAHPDLKPGRRGG